jgi:hypothetical protein
MQMNSTSYCKWAKEKLIPNLPEKSVVIDDDHVDGVRPHL